VKKLVGIAVQQPRDTITQSETHCVFCIQLLPRLNLLLDELLELGPQA
jgi:hypothetical protein